MDLDGQGAFVSGRSELDDPGYILVALLVGIAIASVWMAAALPAWRQQVTRERETELIFRGEQYARAIFLYSQKNGGVYPPNLDDLVNQHYLRKRWKDPITGEDFVSLPAGFCATGVPAGGAPGGRGGAPGRGGLPGGTTGPSPAVPGRPGGAPSLPSAPAGRAPTPAGGTGTPGTIGSVATGICGVASKSDKQSIKIYQQQQQYNLWQFTANTAANQIGATQRKLGGAVAPPGVVPTIPGRRGAPGGFIPGAPIGPGRGPSGGFPGGPGGVNPGQPGPGRGVGPGTTPVPSGPGRGRGGH